MAGKIATLLFVVLWTCSALAEPTKHKPLRDGAILAGADGTLAKDPNGERWLFVFKTTVADDKGAIQEGQAIAMLRSSTLEKMLSIKTAEKSDFRLWGRITQFEGKNFIFPVYFLTLTDRMRHDVNAPAAQKPISINDPNDVVKIPEEVLKKLKPERTVELTQLSPIAGLEEDRMFSDRSGFITKSADGSYVFKPDALGRNVQKTSFAILPNDIVQQTMDEQSHEPNRVRYKVTGILTTYDGQNYILLQRAIRQYSNGNFAR
jgi:hypothetical protein